MFTVNKTPTVKDIRWFAAGMIIGLPLLAALIYALRARTSNPTSFLSLLLFIVAVLGILMGVTAILSPTWGRKLYIAWMRLTLPIGLAMSTVLLSLMYFLVLPIFSLIVRRRDPLRRKLGGQTYWEDYRTHQPNLERMRRPF